MFLSKGTLLPMFTDNCAKMWKIVSVLVISAFVVGEAEKSEDLGDLQI